MGKKVVMAFGAFDGLHMGHLHYLKEAKKLGDYLIIGLARDKATWLPKSSAYRLPEGERKKLLEEINLADEVALGGKNDALEAVKRTDPDILAISEYSPVDITLLQKELKSLGLKGTVVA
ncbi:FAD synthase, partial [archaeon CG10_big_fil_rev_8_21_14_0_10_43_11]